MVRITNFVIEKPRLAWGLALLVMLSGSILAAVMARDLREADRLSRIQIEAQRHGIEIMSQTLNGNVMGSLSLLGVIDEEIKQDAQGKLAPNGPRISAILESLARAYDADGVFVIGKNGILTSSWDISGKPSTGLDVRFRPYFQMAMQGRENVYAAVSMARGDRALYFSTPVLARTARSSEVIGAVVARSSLDRVDSLLRDKADITLLLSPQGVMFAGNRPDWIGFLAGAPTPERLKSIRDLKQFGAMFEKREPSILPFAIEGGIQVFDGRRYALASAKVQWNDPFGDWTLVLLEDLSRTIPATDQVWVGLAVAAILLLIGLLVLNLLRGQHAQALAATRIADYAAAQAAAAERKTQRAEAALRFQRAKSPKELGERFLAEAHRILGALQGMIYVRDSGEDSTMDLLASYAGGADIPPTLAFGEGMMGQCAQDRRPRLLEITDDRAWTIRSGLGDARPAAVMMAPLLLDDTVLGVVEIAVLDKPAPHAREQFTELAVLLALNLEILCRRHGTMADTAEAMS